MSACVDTEQRFSFEALVPFVRARYQPGSQFVTVISDAGRVASVLGVDRKTAYRWRRDGLTELQADRAAHRLGRHPAEIWDDWHPPTYDVMVPLREEALAESFRLREELRAARQLRLFDETGA